MEYEKGNLLDDTTIQPCKFRTRNWVEINYESWGSYNEIMIIIIIIIITIITIIALNLTGQWKGQVCVTIVIQTYLLKKLQ